MTTPGRSLASPAVTLGLAVFLVSLLVLALAAGLLGGGGTTALGSPGASGSIGPSTAPESLAPTLAYPTASPGPTFTSYVVRRGDSLSSIARKFHTTARSISWWNRGTYPSLDPESPGYAPNSLTPGWTLVVLAGTTVDEANPPSPSPAPPSASLGLTTVPSAPQMSDPARSPSPT
jgi:hypothetical protein